MPTFDELYSAEKVPEAYWQNLDRREWLTGGAGTLVRQAVTQEVDVPAASLIETVESSCDDVAGLVDCMKSLKSVLTKLRSREQNPKVINLYERMLLQ